LIRETILSTGSARLELDQNPIQIQYAIILLSFNTACDCFDGMLINFYEFSESGQRSTTIR